MTQTNFNIDPLEDLGLSQAPNTPSGLEREQLRTESKERREQILRFLKIAASGHPEYEEVLKDPEYTDLLIGLYEKQSDGSEKLPREMSELLNKARLAPLNIEKRMEEARKTAIGSVSSHVQKTEKARKALTDAIGSEIAASANSPSAQALKDIRDGLAINVDLESALAGRRRAFVEITKTVAEAVGKKQKQSDLLTDLLSKYGSYLTGKTQELSTLLQNENLVDSAVRDQALKLLKPIAQTVTVVDKTKQDLALKTIDDELQSITLMKRLNITPRFAERADYMNRFGGSDAETVINFATVGDKLNFDLVIKQCEAIGTKPITKDDIMREAGIDATGALVTGWKKDQLISFLKSSGLDNPAGISLSAIYGEVEVLNLKTWQDKVKAYSAKLASRGANAATIWWKWIASLPDNVLPQSQDKELLELIERENALIAAKKAVSGLVAVDEDDRDLKRVIEDVVALQDEIDLNSRELLPAHSPSEKHEQAKILLKAASITLESLNNDNTGFKEEKDPTLRKSAFYFAMTKGVDDARKFLDDPEGYSFAHSDDVDNILRYKGRVNRQIELSERDSLRGFEQKFGVMVNPLAIAILDQKRDPRTGMSYSIDPLISGDPQHACEVLEHILIDDQNRTQGAGKNAVIRAFTTKTTVNGIEPSDAQAFITAIHSHLVRQYEDRNLIMNQLARPEQSRDLLNVIRTSKDVLVGMFQSGDFAQQFAAGCLVVGACYAIHKAWKAKGIWRNALIGIPALIGLDIAVKKATGKGFFDRFGLKWMSEKERNSTLEQMARDSIKEGIDLDSDPGREAIRQLSGVSAQDLLDWKMAVDANGRMDFSKCAPVGESAASAVSRKMGSMTDYQIKRQEKTKEAYKMMYLAFEALCLRVANARAMGGATRAEKINAGARFIRELQIQFYELCQAEDGSRGRVLTYADILNMVGSRLSGEMNETVLELAARKLGIGVDMAKDLLKRGFSWAQIKAMTVANKAPDVLRSAKEGVLDTFDSFMKWARPTTEKLTQEVKDDLLGLYNFLKGTGTAFGVMLVENGPGVLSWVFDKGVDIAKFTKVKAIALWRDLHKHHVTGPILAAFEQFFMNIFGESIAKAEMKEVVEFDAFAKGLQEQVSATCDSAPTLDQIKSWLSIMGGVGSFVEFQNLPASKQALAMEHLRREIFSRVIAERIAGIRTRKKIERLHLEWIAEGMDKTSKKFELNGLPDELKNDYEHIRTNYNPAHILPLIGSEDTWLGILQKYGSDPTSANILASIATGAGYLGDFLFMKTAQEYITNDLKVFMEPLFKKAEEALGKDTQAYKEYSAYLDALVANVILEMQLNPKGNSDFRDTALAVERAQYMLQELNRRRGKTPEEVLELFKNGDPLARSFLIAPVQVHTTLSNLKDVRDDAALKALLHSGAQAQSTPSQGPQPKPQQNPNRMPDQAVINAAIDRVKMNDVWTISDLQVLIQALRANYAKPDDIRGAFDASKDALFASGFDWEKAAYYILGVTDSDAYETQLMGQMKSVNDLASLTTQRSIGQTPQEKVILKQCMDRSVVRLLKATYLPAIEADPKTVNENDLLKLYKATAMDGNDELSLIVGSLLEYSLTQRKMIDGDKNTFQKYLEVRGYPSAHTPTWWGWFKRQFGGKGDSWSERHEIFSKMTPADFKASIDRSIINLPPKVQQ